MLMTHNKTRSHHQQAAGLLEDPEPSRAVLDSTLWGQVPGALYPAAQGALTAPGSQGAYLGAAGLVAPLAAGLGQTSWIKAKHAEGVRLKPEDTGVQNVPQTERGAVAFRHMYV